MTALRIGTVLLSLLLLDGCVLAVAGAAGAGGYAGAKDRRDFGTIVDDAAITTRINSSYVTDELVSVIDIDVDTDKGIVTLTGQVDDEDTRRQAIAIAEGTKGVQKVIPYLTVLPATHSTD
jgi:hyperosmotically inducible protein